MLLPPIYADLTTAPFDAGAEVRPMSAAERPPLPEGVVLATVGATRSLPPAAPPAVAAARAEQSAPVTPAELVQGVEDVGIGGTVAAAVTLDQRSYGSVRIEAGTKVNLRLEGSTLVLGARPGLVLDLRYGPTVRIDTIRYDMSKGEFDVDARGPGFDFVYGPIANFVANHYLRRLLPEELQRAGYEPRQDRAVENGVIELIGNLLTGRPGPAGVRLSDLEGSATVRLPRAVSMDLPDNMRLEIPEGSRFTISPSFRGPPEAPVLRDFSVRALDRRGVTLRKREGTFAPIEGIVIRGADLLPGGELRVDYQPIPEQVLNGGVSLFKLMIAAAGAASGDLSGVDALSRTPVPDYRLSGVRADIDGHIRDEAAPALIAWIREHDAAISGVSLVKVLGLP